MSESGFGFSITEWGLGIILSLIGTIFWFTHWKIDKVSADFKAHKIETNVGFMAVSVTHGKIFELIRELEKTREEKCVHRTEFDMAMTQITTAIIKIEKLSELLIEHMVEK